MSEFNVKNISYLYLEADKNLFKPIEVKKKIDKFIVFGTGNAGLYRALM